MPYRFASIVLAGLLVALVGCSAAPRVATAPPPVPAAPVEVQTPQPAPNYVWVPGHWEWRESDRTYVWVPGTWAVPPAGYSWVPGHWETKAGGYSWVEGHWKKS